MKRATLQRASHGAKRDSRDTKNFNTKNINPEVGSHLRERTESNSSGTVQEKRRTRRRLSLCVVMSVLTMAGTCVAMVTLLMHVQDANPDEARVVNVTLRITNMEFQPALTSRLSAVYRDTEAKLCFQIVKSFEENEFSDVTVTCWVESFWSGSVMANVNLLFTFPDDESDVSEESDDTTTSSCGSIKAGHVTRVLFDAATHVTTASSVRWLLGDLEVDPSIMPDAVAVKRAEASSPPAGSHHATEVRAGKYLGSVTDQKNATDDTSTLQHSHPRVHLTSEGGMEGGAMVHVQCDVTDPGKWRRISILRHERDGSNVALVDVRPLSEPVISDVTKLYDVNRYTVNATLTSESLRVKLEIDSPTCWDAGTYSCWLRLDQEPLLAVTRLSVNSKPSSPTLHVPSDLIEGRELPEPIRCQADLGSPPGRLRMFFLHGNQPLQELKEKDGLSLHYREEGCRLLAELTLTSVPKVNGTEVMCLVQNTHIEIGSVFKETRARLLEIPASVCKGQTTLAKVPHPYNHCRKYLVCDGSDVYVALCPVGHCFHADPAQCLPDGYRTDATQGHREDL